MITLIVLVAMKRWRAPIRAKQRCPYLPSSHERLSCRVLLTVVLCSFHVVWSVPAVDILTIIYIFIILTDHDLFDPTLSQVDRTRFLQWFYTLTSYYYRMYGAQFYSSARCKYSKLSLLVCLLVHLNCIFVCIKLFSLYFVSFVVIFIFLVFLTPQSAPRPRVFGTPCTMWVKGKTPDLHRLSYPWDNTTDHLSHNGQKNNKTKW